MADNIENQYNQKTTRPAGTTPVGQRTSTSSSSTGWILGAVIALAAIAAIWYYGSMNNVDTVDNNVNVEQPAVVAPGTPPADTSTTATTPPADTSTTTTITTPPADTTGTTTPPADTTATQPAAPATDTTTTAPSATETTPAVPPATNQ